MTTTEVTTGYSHSQAGARPILRARRTAWRLTLLPLDALTITAAVVLAELGAGPRARAADAAQRADRVPGPDVAPARLPRHVSAPARDRHLRGPARGADLERPRRDGDALRAGVLHDRSGDRAAGSAAVGLRGRLRRGRARHALLDRAQRTPRRRRPDADADRRRGPRGQAHGRPAARDAAARPEADRLPRPRSARPGRRRRQRAAGARRELGSRRRRPRARRPDT